MLSMGQTTIKRNSCFPRAHMKRTAGQTYNKDTHSNTTMFTAMGVYTHTCRDPGYLRCIESTGVQVALQGHRLPHAFPESKVNAMSW